MIPAANLTPPAAPPHSYEGKALKVMKRLIWMKKKGTNLRQIRRLERRLMSLLQNLRVSTVHPACSRGRILSKMFSASRANLKDRPLKG